MQFEKLTEDHKKEQKDKELASEKFKEEQIKRKALLNELEDIKGKIRVYCRIRPFSPSEASDPDKAQLCATINDQLSVTVHGRIDNIYQFNSVFGPETT